MDKNDALLIGFGIFIFFALIIIIVIWLWFLHRGHRRQIPTNQPGPPRDYIVERMPVPPSLVDADEETINLFKTMPHIKVSYSTAPRP